jgi:hypothetical protein
MRELILLVTPTDRHGDAARLTDAGFRVMCTSQVQSTVNQMVDTAPAVIAVELIPSLAHEIMALLSRLASASQRHVRVLVYGISATADDLRHIARHGASWLPLPQPQRSALATALRGELAQHRDAAEKLRQGVSD